MIKIIERLEQKLGQRSHSNGREAQAKMLSILAMTEMHNETIKTSNCSLSVKVATHC